MTIAFEALRENAVAEWETMQRGSLPTVMVGAATCGRAAGALEVLAAVTEVLEEERTGANVIQVGCVGACFAEPIMNIIKPPHPPILYGNLTPEMAAAIAKDYLVRDDCHPELALGTTGDAAVAGIPRLFETPMFSPQVRIVLRHCGLIDPENMNHYVANGGYSGLVRALELRPEDVIAEISKSGLRGRGGAGFPTGLKWDLCRKAPGEEKYVICNADEGDPGAFMNRSLLESDPHSVVEGMLIGAYAIGASKGYVYCRAEKPLAIRRIRTALKQAADNGLAGENILGSGFSFKIEVREGAGAFVCGEETALIASIEGKRAMPYPRPPFPAQAGLWGKPTNINNVETWGNVSAIMQRGSEWYSSFGTEKSKGTKTFALAGKIKRTGLIEVPLGIPLGEIIYGIGGGILDDADFKAVQTGGPSGGCIPADQLNLPVDYESLNRAGSIMGSGGMVVMDQNTCMVDVARFFITFVQSESCGKCVPCRLGTGQMLDILERICGGDGKPEDIALLQDLGEQIKASSLCGLGQTAPNPVLTTLRYFRDEYEEHIQRQRCPGLTCKALVSYQIRPERCRGCGVCLKACAAKAISGVKGEAHTISQTGCTKCGTCLEVCPSKFGAVVLVSGQAMVGPGGAVSAASGITSDADRGRTGDRS